MYWIQVRCPAVSNALEANLRSEHYALALADLQRRPPQPQRNRLPVVLLLAVLGLLPAVMLWRFKRTQHAAQSSETNQ
jgi:hypothetical protein